MAEAVSMLNNIVWQPTNPNYELYQAVDHLVNGISFVLSNTEGLKNGGKKFNKKLCKLKNSIQREIKRSHSISQNSKFETFKLGNDLLGYLYQQGVLQ